MKWSGLFMYLFSSCGIQQKRILDQITRSVAKPRPKYNNINISISGSSSGNEESMMLVWLAAVAATTVSVKALWQ